MVMVLVMVMVMVMAMFAKVLIVQKKWQQYHNIASRSAIEIEMELYSFSYNICFLLSIVSMTS
jgi:hypothetical protein